MRSKLDDWASAFPGRFKVHYVLSDKWPMHWTHSKGRIDSKILKEQCFPPGEAVYNLLCGPSAMLNSCCRPRLGQLGHDNDSLIVF